MFLPLFVSENTVNLRFYIRLRFDKETTAEPAYSYIVYSRFFAIVELNLVPLAIISLLLYPCLVGNIHYSLGVYYRRAPLYYRGI